MVVLLPSATKIVEYLHKYGKEYEGIGELHANVSKQKLIEGATKFIGDIFQRPPLRSSVSRRLRVRRIFQFDIIELEDRRFLFNVKTESGTYIRKLIHDLGNILGVGAHMVELRRIADGKFNEENSFNLLEIAAAAQKYFKDKDPFLLSKVIQPIEIAVTDFPSIYIKDSAVAAICYGANVAVGGISKMNSPIEKDENVVIKTLKGELVATGKTIMDSNAMLSLSKGIAIKNNCVIMDRDLYPKLWRNKPFLK